MIEYAEKKYKRGEVRLKEEWFEMLHQWDTALQVYESSLSKCYEQVGEEEVSSEIQDCTESYQSSKDADIKILMDLVHKLVPGERPRLEERKRVSETLTFGALPQPRKSKNWFEGTRAKVITCCHNADVAQILWNEINTKTFDELYDIGGEQYERADLLAASALPTIYGGELETSLTNKTVECATVADDGRLAIASEDVN